ncbi:MAG: sodium ion-translocating decarboxylase subunit beta [Limisphaerales bacterium]|jgi:Na+-transporting methylmalonyl-CoA/oxaloacetate decarboxylase beta subunit|nr:sodium ion-translocating decarboxylase subunit beta [Verrucomicrobiota bacterium]
MSLFEVFPDVFQGITTLLHSEPKVAITRIFLIILGFTMMYLGRKGVLEAMVMVPMGLGMATVNAAVMYFDPLGIHPSGMSTLFLEAQVGAGVEPLQAAADTVQILGIDWLQPVFTLTFSNNLIACLVFMGVGSLLDIGYVLARPLICMTIAIFAELGTLVVFPLAVYFFNFQPQEAAAIAIVGGADGPMVLFTALVLAPPLFVPISVVAYLYLGLAYGGYPYLIKIMIPKRLRAIKMPPPAKPPTAYNSMEKMIVAAVLCIVLSLLLPIAAPLIFSLFLGISIRESGVKPLQDLVSGPVLYTATLFLGLTLGILCDVNTILDPRVLPLLLLGLLSLLISGIGGILGGLFICWITGGKVNPVVGIAGVSCVPTTAKVAQKVVSEDNPSSIVLPLALGCCICGVITTAIISGIFCSLLKADSSFLVTLQQALGNIQ